MPTFLLVNLGQHTKHESIAEAKAQVDETSPWYRLKQLAVVQVVSEAHEELVWVDDAPPTLGMTGQLYPPIEHPFPLDPRTAWQDEFGIWSREWTKAEDHMLLQQAECGDSYVSMSRFFGRPVVEVSYRLKCLKEAGRG